MRARGSSRTAVAVAALLAVALAGALVVVRFARADGGGLTKDELLAYQAAVHPPLAEGGRVVEQGMKPAVGLLSTPGADVAPVAAQAQTWVRQLGDVRARVAAVEPPDELTTVSAGFDRALALYAEAAQALGRAAGAPAAARGGIVDSGVDTARQADAAYDDASRVLQDWRRRLGLEPTADFPDPGR